MKTISIYRWSYLAKSKAALLGKVLLTTNHLPDLHITTSNNQNNNKPSIVLKGTLWSSGFLKFSEQLTKSQWYHEMSTLMSSYNVQKQHNLALENVCKISSHLSKSSSPVEPSSVWKGTEWPIIAQNLRSICFQAFLGAFLLQVQGVPLNPHVHKVNRCLARYSHRATTTDRPTNRTLNKPAWLGQIDQKCQFWAKKSFSLLEKSKVLLPT